MNIMIVRKKLSTATVALAAIALLATDTVHAATFTEIGDAGETLSSVQEIPEGSLTLDSISGTVLPSNAPNDADLFRIFIDGGGSFSATTVGGAAFDTQLFLFDSNGRGVYTNDDTANPSSSQSTLPANNPLTPTQPGFYYLGISGFNYDPVSANGEIFPATPFSAVVGPTGPGGGAPLTNFEGVNDGGSYNITLTGARAVPEPASTAGIVAFGALSAGLALKRSRRKRAGGGGKGDH